MAKNEWTASWWTPGGTAARPARVPVAVIVGSIADGDSPEEILTAYPSLGREDIQAALKIRCGDDEAQSEWVKEMTKWRR